MSRHQKLALEYWSDPDGYEYRIQFSDGEWGVWNRYGTPGFFEGNNYEIRRIKRTRTLPEREVPEPVREPVDGKFYFKVNLEDYYWYSSCYYDASYERHRNYAERGLLYETKEDAIAVAKAMIGWGDE